SSGGSVLIWVITQLTNPRSGASTSPRLSFLRASVTSLRGLRDLDQGPSPEVVTRRRGQITCALRLHVEQSRFSSSPFRSRPQKRLPGGFRAERHARSRSPPVPAPAARSGTWREVVGGSCCGAVTAREPMPAPVTT